MIKLELVGDQVIKDHPILLLAQQNVQEFIMILNKKNIGIKKEMKTKKPKCKECGDLIIIPAWFEGKKVCQRCFSRLKYQKKSGRESYWWSTLKK